jgi:hypothetical protein
MPGDYLPDAAAQLAQVHGNLVNVSLTHPSWGSVPVPLSRQQGHALSVTFDEARAPRVSASLSCQIPQGVDVDPRQGPRLVVDAGYRRLDGLDDVQAFVDLGVRSATPSWASQRLDLTAASDELLAIDASPDVAESATGTNHANAVETLLRKTLSPAPTFVATITGTANPTVPVVEDRWDALTDLADRIGAQLYDDGQRTWHLDPTPTSTSSTPDHVLSYGDQGTVISPSRLLTRDGWANYVRVRYRWRDSSGADKQIVSTAYVRTGVSAITGPAGRRILEVERSSATTQVEANAAARSILYRALSRGARTTIQAVAAYWLRPGHTVDVQLPTGTLRHIVSRVVFDLVNGVMTVETRAPLDVDDSQAFDTTTPPPDPATPTTPKPPVADPAPPTKLRYVSEWPATTVASYRGNGVKRTDVDAGDGWQGGFSGGYNGDQRSLALFTGANSVPAPGKRGETGKTIAQAIGSLDSRDDLVAVELVATCEHSWSSAGFDAQLGWLSLTSAPATAPTMRPYKAQNNWGKGSRLAVNLTTNALRQALIDGACRAATLGPAGSLNTDRYGRLGSFRLRLTYDK